MTAGLWPALLPPSRWDDPALTTVSAQGSRLRFADGRELLCATSGLWNVNLGYGNERIAEAVAEATRQASYLSVFRYRNTWAEKAADDLLRAARPHEYDRVLFSTSGGAANDLVMKLARHHAHLQGRPDRMIVAGLTDSYHGLTFGGFALTGEDLGQRAYAVDQKLVRHVPADDTAALEAFLSRHADRIAAFVVEPVQGTGTRPLDEDFVRTLLTWRDRAGFLLVADEVATGFGRTGPLFATHDWSAAPDVLLVSKGLTNGTVPAACVLVQERVISAFRAADAVLIHAETQAGTPLAASAISATLDEFARLDALAAGARLAEDLERELDRLVRDHPRVTAHQGRGLFRSLTVVGPEGAPIDGNGVQRLVRAVADAGAVVHPGPGGVQLIPALTWSRRDLDDLVLALDQGLEAFVGAEDARAAA